MIDGEYQKLMESMEMKTLDYEEIARGWESRNDEWYHALISIENLPIVLSIPNLKVYAWCRYKLIGNDRVEAHHHWHGLVHFSSGNLASWKTKAVGVLRYVVSQGQVSRRRTDTLYSKDTHITKGSQFLSTIDITKEKLL